MPVVLLHMLDPILLRAFVGESKITPRGIVQALALHTLSAQLDRLLVALIVLLHNHILVLVSKGLIVHYYSLLDGFLQW